MRIGVLNSKQTLRFILVLLFGAGLLAFSIARAADEPVNPEAAPANGAPMGAPTAEQKAEGMTLMKDANGMKANLEARKEAREVHQATRIANRQKRQERHQQNQKERQEMKQEHRKERQEMRKQNQQERQEDRKDNH